MGDISYTAFVERGADALDVQVDYWIPGYNDPENGEYFGDTQRNAVITELGGGTGGISGYGAESESAWVGVGLPYDREVHQYSIDFHAQNWFSADSVSIRIMVYAAAYSRTDQIFTADANPSILVGGRGDDRLTGGDGNDTLDGGPGSDTLTGGAGADRISGGGGANTLVGGEGDDVYTVTSKWDTIVEQGDDGFDTVYSYVSFALSAEVEQLFLIGGGALDAWGNAGANRIDGNFYANRLWGMGGNDTIYAGEGADTVYGGEGDDLLDGQGGADRLIGGAGDDTFGVNSLDDMIVERAGEGVDSVTIFNLARYTLGRHVENLSLYGVVNGDFHGTGNAQANRLTGGSGGDTLIGLAGDDVLTGGGGDDVLVGGAGADTLVGGAGSNTASYEGMLVSFNIDLARHQAEGGHAAGDTLIDIQNLTGGSAGDRLRGDAAANVLSGGGGNDRLYGEAGDDVLIGGAGADLLIGGSGHNRLSYAGSIAGVTVDLGSATASGGDATGDMFTNMRHASGGRGADSLTGDDRGNRLFGDAGDDMLTGGAGDDVIEGSAGADMVTGGDGIDALSYASSAAGVIVRLNTGVVEGGDADGDTFTGIEDVIGSAHADRLIGDSGRNMIDGGAGSDVLKGGGGNDVIRGGMGGDDMDGGAGRDTLSYAGSATWIYASLLDNNVFGDEAYGDTISDFENLEGSDVGDALYGDRDANVIRGGGGNDTIGGYGGDDVLFGGDGKDVFVVLPDEGHMTIMDFDPSGGGEYLEIVLGAAFDTYTEVMAAAETIGDDVLFTFGTDLTVLVKGAAGETFAVDAFVFN